MKFDEVRAWKDETYRQSLNEEQIAHPAGMLDDEDLAAVLGGDSPYDGDMSSAAAASSSNTNNNALASKRCHSWGITCDINIFSAKVSVLEILSSLIDIGNSETQVCIASH